MSIITNDNSANQIIQNVITYYEKTFDTSLNNTTIFLSDNFKEDTKIFVDQEDYDKLDDINGLWSEPNYLFNIPTILVNYQMFENSIAAVSTLLHELTHADDFNNFIIEYCNNDWSKLRDNEYFDIMHYWSEYHARVVQIIHMRKLSSLIFPDVYVYDEENIANEMKNFQLKRYIDLLRCKIIDNTFTITEVFTFCARFFVVQLFNPEISIEDNTPKELYQYFPDVEELYNDLKSLQTYSDASKQLETLKFKMSAFLK